MSEVSGQLAVLIGCSSHSCRGCLLAGCTCQHRQQLLFASNCLCSLTHSLCACALWCMQLAMTLCAYYLRVKSNYTAQPFLPTIALSFYKKDGTLLDVSVLDAAD